MALLVVPSLDALCSVYAAELMLLFIITPGLLHQQALFALPYYCACFLLIINRHYISKCCSENWFGSAKLTATPQDEALPMPPVQLRSFFTGLLIKEEKKKKA